MTKTIASLIILVFVVAFTAMAFAAEETSVTGVVMSYIPGQSISVQNDDGTFTFNISADTVIEGDISEGIKAVVDAEDNLAIYVAAMEAKG
jgi:hypothetical protein